MAHTDRHAPARVQHERHGWDPRDFARPNADSVAMHATNRRRRHKDRGNTRGIVSGRVDADNAVFASRRRDARDLPSF